MSLKARDIAGPLGLSPSFLVKWSSSTNNAALSSIDLLCSAADHQDKEKPRVDGHGKARLSH
jgi:hypothetical protein